MVGCFRSATEPPATEDDGVGESPAGWRRLLLPAFESLGGGVEAERSVSRKTTMTSPGRQAETDGTRRREQGGQPAGCPGPANR